jgi:predicted permease
MSTGPNFFQTMKIPLLRGRDFTERDDQGAPRVAVVNEAFVKLYFANRDPIGGRIAWDRSRPEMEIVGVAKDTKYYSLRNEAPAIVYYPYRQAQSSSWMHFELRTAADPHALIPDVRRALASLDRNVPVFDMKTQTEQIDELLLQERLFAKLSSFFGLLALALACVGLYGILSYAVARRTAELGIRMALGAQRRDIVGMILREMLLIVTASLAVGIPAALATARLASSLISDLLYGLKAGDATSVVMAATALLLVAAIAGFLPAQRASRIDPMAAVRSE